MDEIFARESRHEGLTITIMDRGRIRPRFAAYLRRPNREAPLLVSYADLAGDAMTRLDAVWGTLGVRAARLDFESFYSRRQA